MLLFTAGEERDDALVLTSKRLSGAATAAVVAA
jgi:hypothetical protein